MKLRKIVYHSNLPLSIIPISYKSDQPTWQCSSRIETRLPIKYKRTVTLAAKIPPIYSHGQIFPKTREKREVFFRRSLSTIRSGQEG